MDKFNNLFNKNKQNFTKYVLLNKSEFNKNIYKYLDLDIIKNYDKNEGTEYYNSICRYLDICRLCRKEYIGCYVPQNDGYHYCCRPCKNCGKSMIDNDWVSEQGYHYRCIYCKKCGRNDIAYKRIHNCKKLLFINNVDNIVDNYGYCKDIYKGIFNTFEFSYNSYNNVLRTIVKQLIDYSSKNKYNLNGYIVSEWNNYKVIKELENIIIIE